MSQFRGRNPPLVLILLPALLLAGCQFDYGLMDLSLDKSHYGLKAQVEPDEPFEVGLLGNGAHPEAEWQIVEMDNQVIELRDTEYTPARPEGDWYTEAPGGFLPLTIHWFTARTLGESQLVLEVQVDGQVIDRYKVTISVVEDACEKPEEAWIISANWCGG